MIDMPALADAVLDRLIHNAYRIELAATACTNSALPITRLDRRRPAHDLRARPAGAPPCCLPSRGNGGRLRIRIPIGIVGLRSDTDLTGRDTDFDPGVTGSRPGVTGSRPGVTGSRPGVTGSRPGVTGSRPGVTGSRPGGTRSR